MKRRTKKDFTLMFDQDMVGKGKYYIDEAIKETYAIIRILDKCIALQGEFNRSQRIREYNASIRRSLNEVK